MAGDFLFVIQSLHRLISFHASITINAQAFHVYELREPEVRFGIKFEQLLVAFGLFTAGPGIAEVSLQYPGRDAELIIRSWHAQEASFAHLSTVELSSVLQRLDEHWTGMVGSFIAPGARSFLCVYFLVCIGFALWR